MGHARATRRRSDLPYAYGRERVLDVRREGLPVARAGGGAAGPTCRRPGAPSRGAPGGNARGTSRAAQRLWS